MASQPKPSTANDRLLIIGKHWPEPQSTAAGARMIQLIEALQKDFQITFASAATATADYRETVGAEVAIKTIVLNDSSFDEFVAELNPKVVVFDRFMTEEQFGWRIAQHCPSAIRVLDTEDLHGLRKAREQAVKNERDSAEDYLLNDTALREIAAIYRCDLSWIISEHEMELLQRFYGVSPFLLQYLPFMVAPPTEKEIQKLPTYSERNHFVTIGSFKHAPNVDSVRYLKREVWPLIRKQLPEAELHVYGSYPTEAIRQLHSPQTGFLVKGFTEHPDQIMSEARVCLSPLRFGAGLKGKFIQAMRCGTPIATTPIGAEGMHGKLSWAGVVAVSPEELASRAVEIYLNEAPWNEMQGCGFEIIKQRFAFDFWSVQLTEKLAEIGALIQTHRQKNVTGAVLYHQYNRSTEYMARWIEAKNKNN